MGFWSGVWEATKFTGKVVGGAAVGAAIVSTGGAAVVVLGATTAATGLCAKQAVKAAVRDGELDEDGFVKGTVDFVGDCAISGGTDAFIGGHVSKRVTKLIKKK